MYDLYTGSDNLNYRQKGEQFSTNQIQNEFNTKIIQLTSTQRPHIQKILSKIFETNPENARLIYDYILSEQVSFNIKISTRERKIKILANILSFLYG